MGKIKVCLDAGHGGKDSGAVFGDRYEKNDVLKVVKRLGKVLKANGLEVYYTRIEDMYDSPSEKAKKANVIKADYFISVHRNAVANNSANGIEILICNESNKKREIAKSINDNLVKRGFKERGVKIRTDLAVLNQTNMPAFLIELGFITSYIDNMLLDKKFNSIVNAIARGFMKSIGLNFKTITQLKNG